MKSVFYLYRYSSHTRLYALDSCLGEKQKIITEVRSLCKYRENITARPLAAFAEAIKIYSRNANFKQLQIKEHLVTTCQRPFPGFNCCTVCPNQKISISCPGSQVLSSSILFLASYFADLLFQSSEQVWESGGRGCIHIYTNLFSSRKRRKTKGPK